MEPNEEDLRVASKLVGDWGFFIGSDPEAVELANRIASAIAAEREKAAKVAETFEPQMYTSHWELVRSGIVEGIRAGDKE